MPLIYDDDAGWIAVDDDNNYDHELQMEIDAAATASGVAGRDPGMEYRPNLTTTGFGTQERTLADFGHVPTPQITMANLAAGPTALPTSEEGGSLSQAQMFMNSMIEEAARMQEDENQGYNPIALAQEAQQLAMEAAPGDPSAQYRALYPDSPSLTPIVIPETQTSIVSTDPKEGDTRVNADGITETFTNGEWIAEAPAAQPPAPEGLTVEQIMTALNDGHGIIEDWQGIFADWPGTDEQLQEAVAKLASNMVAVGSGHSIFGSQADQVNELRDLYGAYGGTGVTFTAFTEAAGFNWDTYNPGLGTASTSGAATAAAAAAASATDIGSFFVDYFNASMSGGTKRWRQAVDEFANVLLNNKDKWDQYPGLAGKTFTTADEISQWIYQTYNNELTPEQRSGLETAHGVGTTNMSDPEFFAKTASTWGTQDPTAAAPTTAGKDTTTMTKVNPDGTTTTAEVAPDDMPQYFAAGYNTTSGTADGVQIPQGTGQIPWAPGQAPGTPLYDPFTAVDERTFAQEYPGFARSQPGFRMPTIQSAYSRAQAPLQTQYGLQVPDLLMSGEAGLGDPKYQSSADWLRSLTGGTGRILQGADLYGALQNVAGALTSDPNMLGTDPRGDLWRKYFETPGQQAAAYAQPFLMATRGAPEARSALTEAIADAAARFEYQNPAGVIGAGGQRQGFLPWALEQNLLGINQMFAPETRRAIADPETAAIAASAGKPIQGFWDRPASETGAWF